MRDSSDLVSPKQAARALGVSESSLKRWCDQGRISMTRTAGGHRKLPVADVLRFVREQNHPLVHPDLLGLPSASPRAVIGLGRAMPLLVEALLKGEEIVARQLVVDLYAARHRLSVILDDVVAAAFHEIGDRWACRTADVYQERRGCEIALRMMHDLRRMQSPPDAKRIAAGGTLEGDAYALPTAMAELVLRENGWSATSLGLLVPAESMSRYVREVRPGLFWLSVSHVVEPADFARDYAVLRRACSEAGTVLVAGGRGLTEGVRRRMGDGVVCGTMQDLEGAAAAIPKRRAGRRPVGAGRR